MPTSHDLAGLMKFLDRDPWRECLDEVVEAHLGPVLDAGEMAFEDLADLLGDDLAMTLWGCAFEDFLTQQFDVKGGNIVDDYLKRRGWKESAQARAYMEGLRGSVMSLYEVSDIVPGKSLMARDVVRGGEPVAVSEGTATRTLKPWDRIAARIVSVRGGHVLAGGLLAFSPEASQALFDGLRRMFGKRGATTLPPIADADLQAAAPLFTLTWLSDTLERATQTPQIHNAEGDELVFHNVRFPLAKGVRQADIAECLDAVPAMSRETAKFWNWLEQAPAAAAADKAKRAGATVFDTTMDSGARVLGNLELKGRFLHLSTNSAARAQAGTALLQALVGERIRTPLTEIRTVEQMMAEADAPGQDRADNPDLPPEMAEQAVHAYMDQHYRETLDEPVAMLGNMSPRQAARTPAGRTRLAQWLKYLENQSARQPDAADPMATYDFGWMWEELGVRDLRR
ncbi:MULTISPECIES: hypothetical protein [unclassified Roseitalea]|uniref:hypothetical protein n=1 Tax=unclassified Roseitalea TaxID=2639107 RepID=UPI00273FBADD|nr:MULTISPECIES: hypothetical protein [unclassified Roseitalea]